MADIPRWQFSAKQLLAMYWWNVPELGHCAGIIADGSVRSGKTVALSFGFLMWSMERFNGQLFGMCGKTVKSFERNVLNPMQTIVRSLGYTLHYLKSDHCAVITSPAGHSNRSYVFGGNDESSQDLIQGITLAGVLLDEVVLMPESFVNQAFARCSVPGAKVWLNCNPEGPSHYIKARFIDHYRERKFLHVHFTLDDNLSITEEMRRFYETQWTGVFRRRFIDGEWCLASGLVFSSFDPERHVFHAEDDDSFLDGYSEFFAAGDYGTANPTAVLIIGHNRKLDTFDVLDEYYWDSRKMERQKTDDEYVRDISAFAAGYRVKTAFFDPSAASLIAALRRSRVFPRLFQADNAVLDGIRFTSMLFSMDRIRIRDSCRNLIRELQSYSWDEEKSEREGVDAVVKADDHTCDALRYFCYSEVHRRAKAYGLRDTALLADRSA